ncbi:MAG TPA: MFS transporter [Vicinamibacteria bacterium]|nr:MFS transporter [Vicinamibacteria bacterium]
MPTAADRETQDPPRIEPGGGYARYVLGVLVGVYVLNFLDRQILSILAERIKADLGVSDAQMGFLYGTAFAVFYAVFGIPLGRLADVWDRRRLIAWGLSFWSAMTAVSGLARTFTHLALARIGVGVGEASASPAAYSLLSDCFPRARRATVLAVYSSGIYIGSGLGLGIGGWIVDRWDLAWAGTTAPFGLRGWQVAFFAVGLPGLLLAFWVRSLREPLRGQADGILSRPEPHPFREFWRELMAVLPPFTLLTLQRGGAGSGGLALNGAVGLLLCAAAWTLTRLLGTPAQWWALALGLYAASSWTQALALRDRPGFALIVRTPALHFSNLGFAFLSFTGYGIGFWIAPFFVRIHGISASRVGLLVGGAAAAGGWLGVTLGGLLADRWRKTDPRGRLFVGMINALLPLPLTLVLLWTPSTTLALALSIPLYVMSALWLGPGASTVQDLVLPRMRAVASAGFLLVVTLVGLAMGPYTMGRLSVATGDLRLGMTWGLLANLVALGFFLLAARGLGQAEATRLERARAAGER